MRTVASPAVCLVVACAGAVWGTWPTAAALFDHVYDPPQAASAFGRVREDVLLTVWILAWDLHALATSPSGLFAANIFHPFERALALSETMIGALPLYAPLAWLTGSPVAGHQATLLATFVLAFLTAAAAVRLWTASWSAGLVAGALFAFSPMRVAHLGSIQMEGGWWLPVIALSVERTLATGAFRWSALLAASLTLQTLWSHYLGYAGFLSAAVLAGAIVTVDPRSRRHAVGAAMAILVGGAVVAVASLPYLHMREAGVLDVPTDEILRLGSSALGRTGAGPALLVALATAPFSPAAVVGGRRVDVRALWLVAVVTHLIALGPVVRVGGTDLPGPYAVLADVVPGLAMIRVPQRLNAATSMALSLLAGIGIAGVMRRLSSSRDSVGRLAAATALSLGVIATSSRTRVPLLPLPPPRDVPAVYAWLATLPPAPLLELPLQDVDLQRHGRDVEARRMYFSTVHWHRLLNGYSGYTPPGYRVVSALARTLPDRRSGEILFAGTGVRRIVLHRAELVGAAHRRWRARDARRWLRPVAKFGRDVVFEPRPGAIRDGSVRTVTHVRADETMLGTPLLPVSPDGRTARIAVVEPLPSRVLPGLDLDVAVAVANASSARWPSLALRGDRAVGLVYRWEDTAGRVLARGATAQVLPDDLDPEGTTRALISVRPPRTTGRVFLVVGVAQAVAGDGAWFAGESARIPVEIAAPLAPAGAASDPEPTS